MNAAGDDDNDDDNDDDKDDYKDDKDDYDDEGDSESGFDGVNVDNSLSSMLIIENNEDGDVGGKENVF